MLCLYPKNKAFSLKLSNIQNFHCKVAGIKLQNKSNIFSNTENFPDLNLS